MSRKIIGQPTPQLSARDKATGRAIYADDIRVQRPVWIKILRSPHASARICSIDLAPALRMPGVRGAISGRDLPNTFGVLPISKDEPALAIDRVRFVGEGVAAVAAESEAEAEAALLAIRTEYEITPACLTMDEAEKPTSDPIHPELKKANNLHKSVQQSFGNLATGFADASAVVEESFQYLPVTHGFTEPHAIQVELAGDGNLTVFSSTQVPHYLHKAIATVLEIPMHRIRVVKPHLGGGFGGKGDPFPHEMIAVKLALVTGRNTRLRLTREEVFYSHHGRHPTTLTMKLGLHPEKGLTALQAKIRIDGGAYASFGVVTTYYNGVLLQGPYKIPNFAFQCDRLYTNKPMCGAMRGHGGVNPRFASEVLLDMACHQAQVDPGETRLRILHDADSLTPNAFRITSQGMKEGLRRALDQSCWEEKRGKLPFGKGIGVACGFFISGSALPIHWNERPQSTVRLTIEEDGAVTVYSGAADIWQGSDTMLAQIVAEVLGVSLA
ncbi:MAG: molybdopterin cofactor-binding domain-containing protein, partial [Bdellovibrionota bacterium]